MRNALHIILLYSAIALSWRASALSEAPLRFRGAGVDVAQQKYCVQWAVANVADTAELRGFWILRFSTDALGNPKMDTVAEVGNHATRYVDNASACCAPAIYSIRLVPKVGANYGTYEPPFRTMLLQPAALDTCANAVSLAWSPFEQLDQFSNPPAPVPGFADSVRYQIWGHIGSATFNADSLQPLADAGRATSLRYYLPLDKRYYHLCVAAIYNGNRDTSYSNLRTVYAALPLRPQHIAIDSVIGSGQGVALHFAIDARTEYTRFAAEKSIEYNGNFAPFATFGDKAQREVADAHGGGAILFYRISAINSCGLATASSPVATSLSARAYADNGSNVVEWNSVQYEGAGARYTLWRTSPASVAGSLVAGSEATSFRDNLSLLPDSLLARICYRVEAEVARAGGGVYTARSQEVCSEIRPEAAMPNAIQLGSDVENPVTHKRRNLFEPVSAFAMSGYTLTVSSRDGRKIYAGSSPWNGRYDNTKGFVPQATYLYHIRIVFANGEAVEKRGVVSVIY